MVKKKNKNIPELRFPGFEGEWEDKKLGNVIGSISSGKSQDKDSEGVYSFYGSTGIIGKSSSYDYFGDSILVARVGANAGSLYKVSGNYSVSDNTLIINIPEGICLDFIYNNLIKYNLNKLIFGSGQPLITGGQLNNLKLLFPALPEQKKIASFLSAVDERIQQLLKKKSLLEQYKKGVMQQIFSQKIRFKDNKGNDFPDWEEKQLGDCLDYEQPTNYLVNSTEYNDIYEIPVLTAGKTFILGYTNEKEGIFENNLPVVIFDDFTTATKFVNFPFKVKSSAIKILLPKLNINIKYIYESLQMINYELGGHERHWISKFSQIFISVPSLPEQEKIASFLSAIDNKIELVNTQLEKTKVWKKGLLQKMFV